MQSHHVVCWLFAHKKTTNFARVLLFVCLSLWFSESDETSMAVGVDGDSDSVRLLVDPSPPNDSGKSIFLNIIFFCLR